MSSFLVIEKAFFDAYAGIDITPVGAYGAIAEGFEIYNAMNSQRGDYTSIYGFSQQPITLEGSGSFTIPSSFTGSAVLYMKWEVVIQETINGADNNISLYTGAALPGTQRSTVFVYGDANDKTTYFSFIGGSTDETVETLVIYDDQYNDKYFQIIVESDEVDVATYGKAFKLYEVLLGYHVPLPTGYLRREFPTSHQFFGGWQNTRPYGQSIWGGIFSETPRRKFELSFEDLSETQRNLLVDVYKYSRGVFPMLYVADSEDKRTWKKVIMTGVQESEDALAYSMVVGFEEL